MKPTIPLNLMAFVLLPLSVNAASPAFNIESQHLAWGEYTYWHGGNTGMVGWSFKVFEPVTLLGLGWYDSGLDGLTQSHQIGLWSGIAWSGPQDLTFMAELTLSAGNDAPLVDLYRTAYFPSALTLQPGTYTVAGTHSVSPDESARFVLMEPISGLPEPFPNGPFEVQFPAFDETGNFRAPTYSIISRGLILGPMPIVVPEPSGAFLAMLGAGAVMFARARRSRSA